MSSDDRYVFIVEWYDAAASLIRNYNLTYYPKQNAIEMYDLKNKRVFLKKTEKPDLTLSDLYLGSIISVFSRQLKIVDYADVFTRGKFEEVKQKTFAMIKPDAYGNIGKILTRIEQDGFRISNIKMTKMTLKDAQEFYGEHRGKPFFEELTNHMSSDFIVGVELVDNDSIKKWRSLIGPTNCQIARVEAPNSLRALYGQEGVRNACHGSDAVTSARRELDFFFGEQSNLRTTALFNNCSCGVIKPHIINEGNIGRVVDMVIQAGFEISALEMFNLDGPTAEEFMCVYKGVLPEYSALVEHLTIGACISLEVRQEDAVNKFRELCGPHDPELAKTLRPKTIRALFGKDRVKNGIHCTDLPEDGVLESEYFFNILQPK